MKPGKRVGMVILALFVALIPVEGQDSGTEYVEIIRPWNGYWWPLGKGALATGTDYNGQPAPMMKYDQVMDPYQRGWLYEWTYRYQPDAEYWAGYCNGWAAASVLEPQPPLARIVGDTRFNYGDLSGLLTILHQRDTAVVYGTPYIGPTSDKSDIDPLEFQNLLELYLKINGLPIVADVDCEEEVWSYPIFSYMKQWTTSGMTRNVLVDVNFATDLLDHPDAPGFDNYRQIYTYRIQLDGAGNEISAEWTNESINNHPDFLWYPETQSTANPYVTVGQVAQIMNSSAEETQDDKYEPNDDKATAHKVAGFVFGTLKNDDWYELEVGPFDSGEIVVSTSQQDVPEDWSPEIFVGSAPGVEMSASVRGEWRYEVIASAASQRFVVGIPQQYGFDGNYAMWFQSERVEQITPDFMKTTDVRSDLLFINTGVEEVDALLYSRTGSGVVDSYTTMNIVPGGTGHYMFDDSSPFLSLPVWLGIRCNLGGLRTWQVTGGSSGECLGVHELTGSPRQMVIPHIPSRTGFWDLQVEIRNLDPVKETGILAVGYEADGTVAVSNKLTIPKGTVLAGSVYDTLFAGSVPGSLASAVLYTTAPVAGVQKLMTRNGRELTIRKLDDTAIVPETVVPIGLSEQPDGWSGLALFNGGTDSSSVTLVWRSSTNWQPLATTSIVLNPGQRNVFLVSDVVPEGADVSEANRIELEMGNDRIFGYLLTGAHRGGTLSVFELNDYVPDDEWVNYPLHRESMAQPLAVSVRLQNPELAPRTVRLQSRDSNGLVIGDQTFSISPGERKRFGLVDLPLNSEEHVRSEIASVRFISNGRLMSWVEMENIEGSGWDIMQ